jgi:hypothetical protein
MISIVLIAAVSGMSSASIVAAERAYAEMAQRMGQWTAFRATAAPGAVMFVPEPVEAANWLDRREDPPVAVKWQPSAAFVACDGKAAATLGPWQRPTSVGYFTTLWSRSGAKWQWDVDFGDALGKALPPAPRRVPVRRASCKPAEPGKLPRLGGGAKSARGSSPDRTLEWTWRVEPDGSRHLLVYLWNGRGYDPVIDRSIAPDG